MATFTERLELLISATSTGAQNELKKVTASTEELSVAQKGMALVSGGATSALQNLGISGVTAGAALGTAGAAAGAFAAEKIVKFGLDASQAFADVTGQVRAFQRVAGTSAEDSSKLVAAVKELGISPDAAASSFGRLATRIGTGKDHLDQFGVATKDSSGNFRDLGAVVADVSDAYQKAGSASEKAAIGNAAFGKSWQTLSPLLAKGKADLEDIFKFADTTHQVFSQDDLERGRQFTMATRQLDEAMNGLKLEVGQQVIPAFTGAANAVTTVITTFDKVAGGIGDAAHTAGQFAEGLTGGFLNISKAADNIGGTIKKGFFDSIPGVGALDTAVGALGDAFGIGGDKTKNYKDEQTGLQDALGKVADLHVQGKDNTAEYAAAVQDATSKSASFSQTNADLAASLQTVVEKEAAALDQQLALNNANIAVGEAVLNVGSAIANETQAQQDANDAAQVGIDNSAKVADAHYKTEAAVNAVIVAAEKRAIQALGPGASSEDVARAKVDATSQSLGYLAATVPGATKVINDLGYAIVVLPNGKTVVVTADVSDAIAELNRLKQFIPTVPGLGTAIGVAVIPGTGKQAAPAPASSGVYGPSPAALGITPMVAPMAVAAAAPRSSAQVINVNVTAAGLGADVPEIQRAVVDAIRGYVARNGVLEDVTR